MHWANKPEPEANASIKIVKLILDKYFFIFCKLSFLNISDTDLDSGVEYLPESVEHFYCSVSERKDAKVKAIYNLFADEAENGNIKNFPQKLKEYKQKFQEQTPQIIHNPPKNA